MYHISRFLNNRIEQTEKKFEKNVEKMKNNKRGERLHAQRITRYGLKFRVVSEKHIVTLCSTVFITFFLVAVLFVIKCQKCFVLGIFQSFLFLKKLEKNSLKNTAKMLCVGSNREKMLSREEMYRFTYGSYRMHYAQHVLYEYFNGVVAALVSVAYIYFLFWNRAGYQYNCLLCPFLPLISYCYWKIIVSRWIKKTNVEIFIKWSQFFVFSRIFC